MKSSKSIRGRMVAAFVLLAVIIGGGFAVSAFFVIEEIEDQLIDERLARVAEHWMSDPGAVSNPQVGDLDFFVGQQLPQPLQRLAAGTHELRLNDHTFHVLIREMDGERYAIVDDETDFETLEGRTYQALSLAFLGGIALAFLIGRTSASRVILPLTDLADAVKDEQREGTLPGLDAADEIGILARAIEDRTNQLGQALQRERWFTADVSHELRNPLTLMLGAAEVLGRRLKDHPKLQAIAEHIRRNAGDTAQQLNALQELARVPESSHLARIALRPLIEQEIERCQPFLQGKPLAIELKPNADIRVLAIPELVSIAVSHLLRNACLEAQEGVITVEIDRGRIVIEDCETGAPSAIQRNPSERHNPLRSDSSRELDLSMSIVKRVADHLGWVVHHTSVTAAGSRCSLEFNPRSSQVNARCNVDG